MNQSKTHSRKSPTKHGEALREQAFAVVGANIARIEAAERGVGPGPLESEKAPITQIMSAGSPSPRKAVRAASSKGKKVRVAKSKGAKTTKPVKSKARRGALGGGGGEKKVKRMSGLDAAAKVLAESKEPMNAQAIIKVMDEKGYWTSPKGKTPHATLHAAMGREIKEKDKESRFVKKERGLFVANI